VSEVALKAVSLIALVLTFVVSTSMLVIMAAEARRLPGFLLAFLQRAADSEPLPGRRNWFALVVFAILAAGVLFAEVRTLDLRLRQDQPLDIESISELALEAAWIGYLLYRRQPVREASK
jgi:hypothetical protein